MAGDADVLQRVAHERERILTPVVFLGMVFYLGAADALGIRPSTPVYVFAFVQVGLLGLLTIAIVLRRVPERASHLISTVVWWFPVSATLLVEYSNHNLSMALLLVALIAGAGALLDTKLMVGSLVVVDAIAIPIFVRDGGRDSAMLISVLVTADTFAILVHVLMRGALLRAEKHRAGEAKVAQELAQQLAELQRSEIQRMELQRQLAHVQRMEAVGTLAAGVAHDMNNVLASIMSFAELMIDDSDATSRADAKQILTQAGRGAELTRGLLAFSRRGQYRKQVLRLDDVVREIVPLLSRTLSKTIELRMTLGGDRVDVEGDPVQLGQVLVNLALNAADAMAGKGVLTIATSVVDLDDAAASRRGLTAGRHVLLRVTDTGNGMDETTCRRVFDPFFTTKPLGKGTGLGLSTAWGVVQRHGGFIEVESCLGRGTTFDIHLPITTAAPMLASKAPPSRGDPTAATKVLLIDDEPAVLAGTVRLLERRGFSVLTASNGAEGLDVFDAHGTSIGLVILDMRMPVMGGAECFARLRERGDVPVLVATGYAAEAEVQAMVARGAVLIEKPFESKLLMFQVAQLLLPARGS